jgi:hypothetical protein
MLLFGAPASLARVCGLEAAWTTDLFLTLATAPILWKKYAGPHMAPITVVLQHVSHPSPVLTPRQVHRNRGMFVDAFIDIINEHRTAEALSYLCALYRAEPYLTFGCRQGLSAAVPSRAESADARRWIFELGLQLFREVLVTAPTREAGTMMSEWAFQVITDVCCRGVIDAHEFTQLCRLLSRLLIHMVATESKVGFFDPVLPKIPAVVWERDRTDEGRLLAKTFYRIADRVPEWLTAAGLREFVMRLTHANIEPIMKALTPALRICAAWRVPFIAALREVARYVPRATAWAAELEKPTAE